MCTFKSKKELIKVFNQDYIYYSPSHHEILSLKRPRTS